MKLQFDPCTITAETAGAYRAFTTDTGPARAASAAAAALTQAFMSLVPADLLRRAAAMPDGYAWLIGLADVARAMRDSLRAERAASDAAMRADSQARFRFDGAAFELYARLANEAEGHKATVSQHETSTAQLRSDLQKAGLSDAEIARTLAERAAGQNSAADEARVAMVDCQVRIKALDAFMADPLRRVELLGDELRAELDTLQQARTARAADAPTAAG